MVESQAAMSLTEGTDPVSHRRRLLLAGGAGLALASLQGCGTSRPPGIDAQGAPLPDHVSKFSPLPADGALPAGWRPSKTWLTKKKTIYSTVAMNDATVVQAESAGSASGIYCDVDIAATRTRRLQWQWLAHELIPEADVGDGKRDDAVARVLVSMSSNGTKLGIRDLIFAEQARLFAGIEVPHSTLIYVWDTSQPPGSVFHIPETSRVRYLVVESGPENLGQWRSYERDFHADFALAYPDEVPGNVTSVGITTDSNNTNSRAQAWYGDIAFEAG